MNEVEERLEYYKNQEQFKEQEKPLNIGNCLDVAARCVVNNYYKSQAKMAIHQWVDLIKQIVLEYYYRK